LRRPEDFVTFCAWTGRVRWKDQWVSVEPFLHERYGLTISHGISEEGLAKLMKDVPREGQRSGKPEAPRPDDGRAARPE